MVDALLLALPEYCAWMVRPPELPGRYIEALPDAYDKTPGGNNNRLLSVAELALGELRRDIADVLDATDLDTVYGETLNQFGRMLDQPRGKLNDRQYRSIIRAQIACNLSKGDYGSVLAAIRMMLACEQEQVNIVELKNENCAVRVDSIPYPVLVRSGLTTRQVLALIKRLIPVAVRIEASNFEGTFEFGGDDPMEYDERKGFGNVEQTIGGYFGATVGDDDNAVELPILS